MSAKEGKKAVLSRRDFVAVLIPAGLALHAAAWARKGPFDSGGRKYTLKVSSRLVPLDVSVTGKDGEPIEGLTTADFVIEDNGHRRPISNFAHGAERGPLKVMFLIESSDVQTTAVSGLIEALPKALDVLHAGDEVGVASVFPGYKILLEPTRSRAAVPNALKQVRKDQQAYLQALKNPDKRLRLKSSFDDLNHALAEISNKETVPDGQMQLVIALVTDGFDLLNRKKSSEAARLLVKNGTVVAAFIDLENPGIGYAESTAHVVLHATPMGITTRDHGASYFAKETGGPVIQVQNQNYLAGVSQLLRVESGVYQIGFIPPEEEMDGKFHKVKVSLVRPGLKDKAQIRCRKGYWAEPSR